MSLLKNRPKCSPNPFWPELMLNLNCGKKKPNDVGYFCNFLQTVKSALGELSPNLVTLLVNHFCGTMTSSLSVVLCTNLYFVS
jgi:hypothetical protein